MGKKNQRQQGTVSFWRYSLSSSKKLLFIESVYQYKHFMWSFWICEQEQGLNDLFQTVLMLFMKNTANNKMP